MATDIDKLQGDWYVTSLEIGGQEGGIPITGEQMIVVKSDRFESLGMGATYKGTVKLGKEGGVTTIDLIFTAGPEKGNVNRGIYKLAGTKWTLLLNTRTGPRPKKFGVKLGTGHVLEELSRTPAAKSVSGSGATDSGAADESNEAPAGPATAIEGEWQMESAVFNGATMDPAMVTWVKRTNRGDITKVVAGGQTMLHARFTLGAAKGSNVIDYVNLAGANNGKSQEGIYERTGDRLRICMAPPGKPRPTTFESKKGDGRSFTTFTRSEQQ